MARHGKRKFDSWRFNVESRIFEVTVSIVRPMDPNRGDKTTFVAENAELELKIENPNIDELRKAAREWVEKAGKTTWSRWVYYNVELNPLEDSEYGKFRTTLQIGWQLIERCEIGTPTERWRDIEKDGEVPRFGRITSGSPEVGFAVTWRMKEKNPNEFSGLLPFDPSYTGGLGLLASALANAYERLRDALVPGGKEDPGEFLAHAAIAANSGSPYRLIDGTGTVAKKGGKRK